MLCKLVILVIFSFIFLLFMDSHSISININKTVNKIFKTDFTKFNNTIQWYKEIIMDYKAVTQNQ